MNHIYSHWSMLCCCFIPILVKMLATIWIRGATSGHQVKRSKELPRVAVRKAGLFQRDGFRHFIKWSPNKKVGECKTMLTWCLRRHIETNKLSLWSLCCFWKPWILGGSTPSHTKVISQFRGSPRPGISFVKSESCVKIYRSIPSKRVFPLVGVVTGSCFLLLVGWICYTQLC